LCVDEQLVITAQFQGEIVNVQWYRNDIVIYGQNQLTLRINNILTSHSGTYGVDIDVLDCNGDTITMQSNRTEVIISHNPSVVWQNTVAKTSIGYPAMFKVEAVYNTISGDEIFQ
jgi:hypothetical protein